MSPHRFSISHKPTFAVLAATLVILIGLASGGPFLNPLSPGNSKITHIQYIAGDNLISTSIGLFDVQKRVFMTTDNKNGALVFGPYLSLEPACYSVTWFGTVRKDSRPQFEIFSTVNGVVKSESRLISITKQNVPLQIIQFKNQIKMSAIEFRVLVNASDDLEIKSIDLVVHDCKIL